MSASHSVTTIEELLALPDDGLRHELLDGEHVVTPAPSLPHQMVLVRLYEALRTPVHETAGLELLWSPADIYLGSRTLVQPDLFVVRMPATGADVTWKDAGVPLITIEVLSPSTAARDRGKKRRLYLAAGVEEYWTVDIEARLIERWHVGDDRPEIVDGVLEWALTCGARGEVDVPALFAAAKS